MTAIGNSFEEKKKECRYRASKIEEVSRTSSGGRFYDYCKLTKKPCKKYLCRCAGGEK